MQCLSAEPPQSTRDTIFLGQDLSSGSRGHSDLLGLNTSCTKLYSLSSAQILSDEHRLLRRQLQPAPTSSVLHS